MEGFDVADGLTGLAILGVAGLLSAALFGQLEDWWPVWTAWLTSDAGMGFAEDSPKTDFFSQLPLLVLIYYILAVIALASPVALTFRRN